MQLKLQDAKGLTGVFIEVPLEQLKEEIGLVSSEGAESTETAAHLKESQEKVVELEGKAAELEEKLATAEAKTIDDFMPTEKANFVIAWAKELSLEDRAIFCEAVGISIAKATEAEVAEAEAKQIAEGKEVEEPNIIEGKTDCLGCKFLKHLNLSVKE